MNKKTIVIVFLGVLSIAGIGFLIFQNKKPEIVPKNTTIVAFGDSLVEGIGATKGNDFVSVVSDSIGKPIINKGKSGDTTASALARIDEIIALDPGIVIVLIGGNDFLRGVPEETTFITLEKIVDTFEQNQTIVLLLGVRGGIIVDTYASNFEALAIDKDLQYVPNVLDGLLGNEKYMSDPIHPNDLGYERIADRVVRALEQIL